MAMLIRHDSVLTADWTSDASWTHYNPLSEIWSCNIWHLRQSLWEPGGKDKPSQAKAWVSPQSGERNWEAGLRMKSGLHGSEEYDVLGGRRNRTNRIRACTPFAHREQSGRRANLTALGGFPVFRSNSLDILTFLQSPCLFKLDGPAVRQHQSNKHTINSCRTTG